MMSSVFTDNNSFNTASFEHLITVLLFTIAGYFLIYYSKNHLNINQQHRIASFYAYSLSITIVIWSSLKIYLNDFNPQTDLPLNLCNLVSLFAPVLTISKKKIYFELFFFWVMAGTLQAVFTPSLEHSFPHYDYFKYWHVHAGLVIFILYITIMYNYRLTFKSVLRSFYGIQIYLVLMLIINHFLGSNYFFLNEKPVKGSMLDWFGDWPNYIFVAELIMIPFFSIFYLPFYFLNKKELAKA